MLCAFALLSLGARGDTPADLDGLVSLALSRDPAALALSYDADAARWRAAAAGRWMPPELMLAADALGAPKDSADPTMLMVGGSQMLRGPGEARTTRDRLALDATRAEADRLRMAADLRVRLWQLAAALEAEEAEGGLVDDLARAARALEEIGLARYGAGASPGGNSAMAQMPSMSAEMPSMGGTVPPVVGAGASGGNGMGMPGMGGMGGMGGTGGRPSAAPRVPSAGGTAMPAGTAAPMGGGEGLAALLRLDAEVARLEAEGAGLAGELAGDRAVLAALVGEEAAAAVAADPARYLGVIGAVGAPERELARIDVDTARASVDVARAQRSPDFMISAAERFMPGEMGMPGGTDVSLGATLPLWGSQRRTLDAARADAQAADARAAAVDRDLAVAATTARAAWESAKSRSDALEQAAVPRARQAWDAAQALYAADRASADDAVRAWQTWIQIEREAVLARRDVAMRAAELARLGGV